MKKVPTAASALGLATALSHADTQSSFSCFQAPRRKCASAVSPGCSHLVLRFAFYRSSLLLTLTLLLPSTGLVTARLLVFLMVKRFLRLMQLREIRSTSQLSCRTTSVI